MAWLARRTVGSHALHSRLLSTDSGSFAGIPGLKEPKHWFELASDAVVKCQALVNQTITGVPSIETVRLLDDISDTLCQVIDAAEFCRNVHADPEWRTAAENVCVELGSYVHDLNTNYALYTALSAALPKDEEHAAYTTLTKNNNASTLPSTSTAAAAAAAAPGWDEETLLVGRMLKRDFERCGVHLNGPTRDRMAELVMNNQALGYHFTQNLIDPKKCGQVVLTGQSSRDVDKLGGAVRRMFRPWQDFDDTSSSGGRGHGNISGLAAAGTSGTLGTLLVVDDAHIRKKAYQVYYGHPIENLKVLDELVATRHEMAAVMGYPSYAAYQLDGFSLAGIPEAVDTFLDSMAEKLRMPAENELLAIRNQKYRYDKNDFRASLKVPSSENLPQLEPWDTLWSKYKFSWTIDAVEALRQYITLDGCVSGMSALFGKVLGVRLREEEPSRGEIWAPGVRKLVAEDSIDGKFIGIVYLDLYRRAGKFPGAAHFTLRCGKDLDHGKARQTPIVAIAANFSGGGSEQLSLRHIETLLHEFGHALNSLLSKTKFQHLSGTRGPQDVLEIPSHVFEQFASDPTVLNLLAKHSTGGTTTILPERVLTAAAERQREFEALNLQDHVAQCAMDQLFHGENPPVGEAAERQVAQVMAAVTGHAPPPGAHMQLRFNHLIGYGANYYCYTYAKCLTAYIWENNGINNSGEEGWPSGKVLRNAVLEPGGAKLAHHYVSDMFKERENGSEGVLVPVQGGNGWYPRADALLRHLHLA